VRTAISSSSQAPRSVAISSRVCGYGDSVSYEQLVNDVAKAKIDKSSRFTDWSRRPL
jgi:ribonuclease D